VSDPRERRIALPHLELAAQAWGGASLPPLLALHGWLDNAGSFAHLAPRLAARWRVIALDLPGHGHSSHLAAGASYHYVDYVQAVMAAADALELPRFSLLGHSLGAGIASLVAAARPERIKRLLLIEGLGPLGDDGTQTLERFRKALALREGRGKPLRTFRDVAEATAARSLASAWPAACLPRWRGRSSNAACSKRTTAGAGAATRGLPAPAPCAWPKRRCTPCCAASAHPPRCCWRGRRRPTCPRR